MLEAVARRRVRAGVAATFSLCLALLSGCGSSNSESHKQALIAAALHKYEHELTAEKGTVPRQLRGKDLLGAVTLFYASKPAGVSESEWNLAISHDTRLRRLEQEASVTSSGGPASIELPTPPAVTRAGGAESAEYERGKRAVAQSGCLACHKIGASGNSGPGPDLTEVAGRLPRRAIERTLVKPVAPMPSFRNLPRAKFHAIVAFLSQLK